MTSPVPDFVGSSEGEDGADPSPITRRLQAHAWVWQYGELRGNLLRFSWGRGCHPMLEGNTMGATAAP